ncbi:MAG: phosphoenolpyruvate carboxykinase (ATP), partial [Olegusella sp.]|nr:phosphoenolpyruvate carboxykinase (ATP) [Olegusella sp.]
QGFRHDSTFNMDVPVTIDDVPSELLDPKATWKDAQAYDRQAVRLAEMFIKNQQQRFPNMDPDIIAAGPQLN